MRKENLLQSLWFLIDLKTRDLQEYVLIPSANDIYIKKQNLEIAQLTSIYNTLESLSNFELWQQINYAVEKLFQQDSELSGVDITLRLKEHNDYFGKLYFYSSKEGI